MTANEDKAEGIKELLENINWGFIAVQNMLDVTTNFPVLRSNAIYRKIFSDEMARRFDNSTNICAV